MADGNGSVQVENAMSNGERRGRSRHRWGPIPPGALPAPPTGDAPAPKRRRRSRWDTDDSSAAATAAAPAAPSTNQGSDDSRALMLFPGEIVLSNGIKVVMPPALTGRHPSGDPELVSMHKELVVLERKIRAGIVDIPPEGERSPSPPPQYDSMGIRLNTREVRYREKQSRRRNHLIEELIKRDPLYKPPVDYKPEKKSKKIFIPYKQYPDYNFIGLIIGPRGHTQKKMQEETNTRIAIRGRGSVKEGAARETKYDYGEDEELHVYITGDRQEDVDAASVMIEKLLEPIDEEMNEHKQKQLRELALINGTLKDEANYCFLCGQTGHRQIDCPSKSMEVYRLPDAIQTAVDEQYARDLARMNPGEAVQADEECKSFLEELGGTDPRAMPAMQGGNREKDNTGKLWIGNLPPSVDAAQLRSLFEPYGIIVYADVRLDTEGNSRGFGFVYYTDETMAKGAIDGMHGYLVDGKALIVRKKLEDGSARDSTGGGGRGRGGLGSSSGGGGGGGPNQRPGDDLPPECKIYVGNIPHHIDQETLKGEFSRFGHVVYARIIFDRETQRPKGYGFVAMTDPVAAQSAIAGMNGFPGFDPTARPLVVRRAGKDGGGGGGGGGGGYGRGRGGGGPGYPPHPQSYNYNYGGAPGGGYPPLPPDPYPGAAPAPGLPPLPPGPYPPLPPMPPPPEQAGAYPPLPPSQAGYDPYAADPYASAQYYPPQPQGHHQQQQYYGAGGGGEYSAVPPPPLPSGDGGSYNINGAAAVAGGVFPPLPPLPPPEDGMAPPPPPPSSGTDGVGMNGAPPNADGGDNAASEYERFMSEMTGGQ